jgi:16S rRNA (cytidine1402-2'-O)-methyltransferase
MNYGKIFLIPTFLSPSASSQHLPDYSINKILELEEFIVEELKTARRFLKKVGYKREFDEVIFHELNEHTDPANLKEFIKGALLGRELGLISEAGVPCIADPGSDLVMLAHQSGIRVIPLAGPGSIYLGLMASGLNGQKFTFHGYLPVDKKLRKQSLIEIEKKIRARHYTQIFIETPYRNLQLYEAILNTCSPELMLCIACDITSENEFIKTMSLADWKKEAPDIHKRPVVFLMNI